MNRVKNAGARPWISVCILLLLTEAVYLRPSFFSGGRGLMGMDYFQLHIRRISFVREALFGPAHTLPAWYPRELMGSPFLANLQNFPWIPTRLILLLFPPWSAYGVGVAMAAGLAALFTYLYCRRVGLSEIGAIAAGWTFACAGFFASRVLAGHLPLLEAYPALPLLLWLVERAVAPERGAFAAWDLMWIAVASACVAAAGHPQLPAYSIGAAALYVVVRGYGGLRWRAVSAMALGVGMTMVVWWPMLLLIQRSTRLLRLSAAANDVAMPYGRLAALIRPGIDGWPSTMPAGLQNQFHGYANDAYFWDTSCYVGLLPLVILVALLVRTVIRRQAPRGPLAFLSLIGVGAFLFSLEILQPLRVLLPGTIFRSPARLLYLSTFATAVALGFGVTAFLNSGLFTRRVRLSLVALCLVLHVVDLGGFARLFVMRQDTPFSGSGAFGGVLARELKDGRIATDDALADYDDVGVFDSILLAEPYRALLGASGAPAGFNEQSLDASNFSLSALQIAGVRFVITGDVRPDLELVGDSEDAYLYRVANPAPRAAFFGLDRVAFVPREKMLDLFLARRDRDRLLLPVEAGGYLTGVGDGGVRPGWVTYSRVSSDEIRLGVEARQAGFAQVLEAWDPGWGATVDGRRAVVTIANGFSMAVPVAAGRHLVDLRYRTPGRGVGLVLSGVSAGLLFLLIRGMRG